MEYDASACPDLDDTLRAAYARDGYLIARGLFAADEIAALRDHAREELSREKVMEKADAQGNVTKLKMWNSAGDDLYGMFCRNQRMVDITTDLLGGETYLYSHKMTMKEPRVGGAWEWHQDYGYWYDYGCLAPEMMSILVAVDDATIANGCLRILERSHHLGRLDHFRQDDQTNADRERAEQACKRFQHRHVELEAGDALVFHCNLLHTSDANRSDNPRWAYICSYNTVANAPYKRVREYGNYEPMVPVPRGAIRERMAAPAKASLR